MVASAASPPRYAHFLCFFPGPSHRPRITLRRRRHVHACPALFHCNVLARLLFSGARAASSGDRDTEELARLAVVRHTCGKFTGAQRLFIAVLARLLFSRAALRRAAP